MHFDLQMLEQDPGVVYHGLFLVNFFGHLLIARGDDRQEQVEADEGTCPFKNAPKTRIANA